MLDVERRVTSDARGEGVRTHVWELSLAVRDVHQYLSDLVAVRRRPTLARMRTLVGRRAELAARRTALVDRLESADVTRGRAALPVS